MSSSTKWKIVSLVLGVLLVGTLVTTAFAIAGVTKVSAGSNTKVALARGSNAFSTTATSWTALPGGSVQVRVPAGHRALLLATFSGESICSGGAAADECDVRILFNGNQGQPGPAGPNSGSAFDSVGTSGADYREIHSMMRSKGPVGPGLYTVKVEVETCCGTSFNLDDWTLAVQSFKVS